jgi:hypothetical protein
MRSGVAGALCATVLAGLASLAALAGCQADPPVAGDLGATTPAPSGAPTLQPLSPADTTAGTTPAPPVSPVSPTPLETYGALVSDWQRARSAFFTAVASGERLTLGEEHRLARGYLAALRRLAGGLRSTAWPAVARPAVRELLAANAQQQRHLMAMAQAGSPFAFTQRLADYGVDAARENRAVAAVTRALGG